MPMNSSLYYLPIYLFCFILFNNSCLAQENYEIQVYESKIVEQGFTMFELHSNFTINGFKDIRQGVLPTDKALHETIEITHGFNPWFEIGIYQFLSKNNGNAFDYVGNHIRPRFTVPEKYDLPIGLSLSMEMGYQRRRYSDDNWSLELRPIIDKTIGKITCSFNPVLESSLAGPIKLKDLIFAPNLKLSYKICKLFNTGIEYYNALGSVKQFDAFNHQPHQLVWAFDFYFSEVWEFNIGYVKGLTSSVEQDIIKCYVGRKIGKHASSKANKEN